MAYLDLSLENNGARWNRGARPPDGDLTRLETSIADLRARNRCLECLCGSQQETIAHLRVFEPPVPA
jgi:hypothetical protein